MAKKLKGDTQARHSDGFGLRHTQEETRTQEWTQIRK
jgi:hypothetical protein